MDGKHAAIAAGEAVSVYPGHGMILPNGEQEHSADFSREYHRVPQVQSNPTWNQFARLDTLQQVLLHFFIDTEPRCDRLVYAVRYCVVSCPYQSFLTQASALIHAALQYS